MTDLALVWDSATGSADLEFASNDLSTDDGLETAVMISLFTDRYAESSDDLPDGETDRRGWWADDPEDRIGSRLWTLARSTDTADVLPRMVALAKEALQWMVDDNVAAAVDVEAESIVGSGRDRYAVLAVTIHRPKVDPVNYRWNFNWVAQEARRVG